MTTVWVATYSYKHGETTLVFASEAGVHAWRAEIAAEYWDRYLGNEPKPPTPQLLADAYFEAMQDYGYDESMVWTSYELQTPADALVTDLWNFIENVTDEDPERQSKFFALRERVRGAPAPATAPDAPAKPKADPTTLRRICLDAREHGTVLAALRYWQDRISGKKSDIGMLMEIAEDAAAALSADEIDELCESINC